MRKFKKQLITVTLSSFIILLSLNAVGCGSKGDYKTGDESLDVDTDVDVSISSLYYLSLGNLVENVVRNGAGRHETEVTVADKKVVFPQGKIRGIAIKSWSRKEKAYNPPKSEIIQYVDALENAKTINKIPNNVSKKMIKIETHILYLNSHGEFRTVGVTDWGNGYHEISVEKDDAKNFAKGISIKSDTGKKYKQIFLRSTEAEKILKEWIHWESQGKKGFKSIQSVSLSVDGKTDEIKFTENQLKILKTYLKSDKKSAEAPCGYENHFECTQSDGNQFHFSISADGESISTDKSVYVVDYPDNMEMVYLLKELHPSA